MNLQNKKVDTGFVYIFQSICNICNINIELAPKVYMMDFNLRLRRSEEKELLFSKHSCRSQLLGYIRVCVFKNWLSYIDPLPRNSRYKHYNANCNSSWHNQWATSQFTRYQYMKYMGFWRIHLGLKYLKLWSWIPQGYDSYFNN